MKTPSDYLADAALELQASQPDPSRILPLREGPASIVAEAWQRVATRALEMAVADAALITQHLPDEGFKVRLVVNLSKLHNIGRADVHRVEASYALDSGEELFVGSSIVEASKVLLEGVAKTCEYPNRLEAHAGQPGTAGYLTLFGV